MLKICGFEPRLTHHSFSSKIITVGWFQEEVVTATAIVKNGKIVCDSGWAISLKVMVMPWADVMLNIALSMSVTLVPAYLFIHTCTSLHT